MGAEFFHSHRQTDRHDRAEWRRFTILRMRPKTDSLPAQRNCSSKVGQSLHDVVPPRVAKRYRSTIPSAMNQSFDPTPWRIWRTAYWAAGNFMFCSVRPLYLLVGVFHYVQDDRTRWRVNFTGEGQPLSSAVTWAVLVNYAKSIKSDSWPWKLKVIIIIITIV